jgi:hypothetical protein
MSARRHDREGACLAIVRDYPFAAPISIKRIAVGLGIGKQIAQRTVERLMMDGRLLRTPEGVLAVQSGFANIVHPDLENGASA